MSLFYYISVSITRSSCFTRFYFNALANIQYSLSYALSFSVNALWLAALYYANPSLFHYLLRDYHFLFTPYLFTPTFSGTKLEEGVCSVEEEMGDD